MNVLIYGTLDSSIKSLFEEELASCKVQESCLLGEQSYSITHNDCLPLTIVQPQPDELQATLDWILKVRSEVNSENMIIFVLIPGRTKQISMKEFIFAGADIVSFLEETQDSIRIQLRCALKLARMQNTITRLNSELFQTSITDSLTHVLNRNGFTLRLDVEWRLCLKNSKSIGLITIDIDHFKAYNDHYGHIEADNCLLKIAQELPDLLKGTDHYIGRQGGEEFIVLLTNVDEKAVDNVSEALRVGIQDMRIEHQLSPSGGQVTVSIGSCACKPTETTMEKMIQTAETALKQAKKHGRNQCKRLNAPQKLAQVVYLKTI